MTESRKGENEGGQREKALDLEQADLGSTNQLHNLV